MQVLLTEQEYDKLKARANDSARQIKKEVEKKTNEFCQEIANTVPIPGWHTPDGEDAAPWGCVHTPPQGGYCDDCPARKFCSLPQRLSK